MSCSRKIRKLNEVVHILSCIISSCRNQYDLKTLYLGRICCEDMESMIMLFTA